MYLIAFFSSCAALYQAAQKQHLQKSTELYLKKKIPMSQYTEQEIIEEGMQHYRALILQRDRLIKEFGRTHAGVIRTHVLIEGVEERLKEFIPSNIIQEATENL